MCAAAQCQCADILLGYAYTFMLMTQKLCPSSDDEPKLTPRMKQVLPADQTVPRNLAAEAYTHACGKWTEFQKAYKQAKVTGQEEGHFCEPTALQMQALLTMEALAIGISQACTAASKGTYPLCCISEHDRSF